MYIVQVIKIILHQRKKGIGMANCETVADLAVGGLRGLQPPVSESSSAAKMFA